MRELKVRKRAELRLVVLAVTPATTSTATSSRRRRADGGLADWHGQLAGEMEGEGWDWDMPEGAAVERAEERA